MSTANTGASATPLYEEIHVRQDGARHQGCDESSGWIWYAARVLNDYLITNAASYDNSLKLNILELGSGTGWLALQLASRGFQVTATDREGALPLLIRNVISTQEGMSGTKELDLEVALLEWRTSDEYEAPRPSNVIPGKFDLVIGSDILYLSEHYAALLETLAQYECQQYIISFEERKPKEEALFLEMATSKLGFSVERKSAGVNPTTGNPVWIVCMTYQKS